MPKRFFAIANCRVSTPEQTENGSLSRQATAVRDAADELGVTIIRVWPGNVSSKAGTNVDRKDLEQMLELCKKDKRIRYVIIDELDRFMRSILEIGYFLVLFRKLGVEVVFASQPNLKTDTAANTLLLMLEAYKAEGSNEERQKKSISGQSTALKAGKYPFHPKAGYMRGTQTAVPEIHPVRGIALREVLIRLVEHRIGPTEALIELNSSDYTLERAPLKMDKFRKIATDPFYASIVEIDQQVKVRNEAGMHEPLITLEQHYELVRIFSGKKKNQTGPRKNGNPKYPLNAITVHDACVELRNKGKFVGYDHGNGKNPDLVYEKYRCRSCGFILTRDELHAKVVSEFDRNPITDEGTKDFIEALDIVWRRKEAQAQQDGSRISQKITAVKIDINNRAIAAIDPSNIAIKAEVLASIEKMKEQVAAMENELSGLGQKADADQERFLLFAFGFVNDMGHNFLSISQENRLRCKQIIFPAGFYMSDEKNVYTPEISSLITLQATKKDTKVSKNVQMVRVRGL